jgi:hypothetical protein
MAVISIAAILALESVTVFAASPTADVAYDAVTGDNQEEENDDSASTPTTTPATTTSTVTGPTLSGAGGDTTSTTVIETTTEQVVAVQETVAAPLEVKETKTHEDGSKTTTFGSDIKDATTGVEKTVAVTEKTDGTIEAESSSGITKNTFVENNVSYVVQSMTTKERVNIAPADNMTKFEPLRNDVKIEAAAKATDAVDNLQQTTGANAESITFFEASGDVDENGGWNLTVPGARPGDPYWVLHKKNGNWETSRASVNRNNNLYIISGSKSPFIIIKLDKDVSGITTTSTTTETDTTYAQPSSSLTNGQIGTTTSTISGDISPQTGETYPYAATISVIALACVIACTKKRATK